MGAYKNRIKLKYGSNTYEKRIKYNNVYYWYEYIEGFMRWEMIKDNSLFSLLDKRLEESKRGKAKS